MKKIIVAAALSFCTGALAQEDDERVYTVSCSLYVKTSPFMPDSGDVSGRAMVNAVLCDKSGIPIPGQKIAVTVTCGTLSCPSAFSYLPADSVSQDRSCYISDQNGNIEVFLSDIPFNKPGKVKASCVYGDIKVQASSSFLITRKIIKRGIRKKPSSRTRSPSVK
ncbi:MAG: hypothetical protein JXA71_10760 [Chitinispirillaceae bacterium]|nr:hypothetical protein [Chitinispirillaceae bacterium]